jgi:hypothetical protein
MSRIHALLLLLLVVGLCGTALDLALLAHYEDSWQLVPFVLIGVAFVVIAWQAMGGGAASIKVLRGLMLVFIVAGGLGLILHYQANAELQRDMNPAASGSEIFWKAIRSQAPPSLAPLAMAQLGLLGLVYTYRHPALAGSPSRRTTTEGV